MTDFLLENLAKLLPLACFGLCAALVALYLGCKLMGESCECCKSRRPLKAVPVDGDLPWLCDDCAMEYEACMNDERKEP